MLLGVAFVGVLVPVCVCRMEAFGWFTSRPLNSGMRLDAMEIILEELFSIRHTHFSPTINDAFCFAASHSPQNGLYNWPWLAFGRGHVPLQNGKHHSEVQRQSDLSTSGKIELGEDSIGCRPSLLGCRPSLLG